jgi:hypothetical protein
MVLQLAKGEQCIKCGKQYYTNTTYIWCKPCQINYLKANFINRTSDDKKIDDFVQEIQLKFDYYKFLFEWIPYNQFSDIEMGEEDSATAIWKDGPLYYNFFTEKERMRISNKKVSLKYSYDLQNVAEFLNKVQRFVIFLLYNCLTEYNN